MEHIKLNPAIAQYGIGQLVLDALFDFRGVVIDVDATYQESEELYNRWDTVAGKKDSVQLASEQSFPASDPPGRNDQME